MKVNIEKARAGLEFVGEGLAALFMVVFCIIFLIAFGSVAYIGYSFAYDRYRYVKEYPIITIADKCHNCGAQFLKEVEK